MNEINGRVRKIRKQAKCSQARLGKMLNLKTSTYSQKEREGKFTGEDLLILADIFKVDIREFLYENYNNVEYEIKPYVIIPDECYMLNNREGHIITMYRNVSKEKQKEIFAFIFNTFKNK